MKKFFAIICLILVTGCAKTHQLSDKLPPANELPMNSGFLVGSFTADSAQYHRGISFRSKDGKTKDTISYNPDVVMGGLMKAGPNEELFVFALPAGDYEFYSIFMRTAVLGGDKTWSSKEDFSIPFKIEAGKINYVGDINNIKASGKNLFGITIPAGGYFEISDKSSSDLPALKSKYTYLSATPTINIVPKSGNVPPQLVQFK